MAGRVDVDVWLRGTNEGQTVEIGGVPADASTWTDEDVRVLLTEMLLALDRVRNPGGEPPPVSLRGFNWIVSPDATGVLVHIEMQVGTASAGPFPVDEASLTARIARVMATGASGPTVH